MNESEPRLLLDLNIVEGAYVLECLAHYSSEILTGEPQDVYSNLLAVLERTSGGRQERKRVMGRRQERYVIPQKINKVA